MIEIDGSYGEGGGQILRLSVALSALLGKPVKVKNIRAKRPNPGLRRQHITAIEAVKKICGGSAVGLKEGSLSIEFYPGKIIGGEYAFNIGTAGSITLVLQACILPSIFAEKETKLVLTGGTDVKWSPSWDYFQHVFLPLLKKMGISIEANLLRRGYYPKGMGKAEVKIQPCKEIHPPSFKNGELNIEGIVHIANLPIQIAQRVKNSAENEIKRKGMESSITIQQGEASSPGIGIALWASNGKIIGADCLGERGLPAEKVGKNAAQSLLKEIEAGVDVDERAVDQILPYVALASSSFTCRKISKHAETEMWLLRKFLDVDFEVKGERKKEVRALRYMKK